MGASPILISAVEALWRVPRPGPNNLLAAPTFTAVSDVCRADYVGDKPVFALSTAVRSLGVPCWLPAGHASLSVDPLNAANAIDEAFTRKTITRRHLWARRRSEGVDGRAVMARSLARSVARGLVGAAAPPVHSRVDVLAALLDRGVQYL